MADYVRTSEVIRIKRYYYVHILDNNTNVTRSVSGPLVYTRKEHETCLFEPKPCVSVPPRCYCIVKNPVARSPDSSPVFEVCGQVRLQMGNTELRFESEPFPLFPGEELVVKNGKTIFDLEVIPAGNGLHVRCVRDFVDQKGQPVCAGSEWMEKGPKTYIPRIEVEVVRQVKPSTIAPNTALRVKACYDFVDQTGTPRTAGESWLVKTPGSYLPAVEEQVERHVQGVVLDKKKALQLRALQTFTDVYGKLRKAGDLWLVTHAEAPVHIVDVMEEEVSQSPVVTLNAKQYCVVVDMVDDKGRNRYGYSEVIKGPRTFFLQPGESLRGEVENVIIVNKDEALLLKALSTYTDRHVERTAGTTWMLHGPAEYVPVNNVEILERRKVIALDQNEGIYVMDVKKGTVRAVIGKPYMPNENEILWEKYLPGDVEELLTCPGGSRKRQRNPNFTSKREKHHVVRFNVQHNAAVQIYDYKMKKQRIVMGPDLVMLAPHEEFTVLSLSGGKPKVPNALQSLQLFLGPRFSSDTVVVETSDHARLSLRLSYNWYFDVTKDKNGEYSQKTFSVPDFIGDCCKTIASRVRGAVAAEDFDSFHRNSTKIIRTAVFGVDEGGEVRKELRFVANDFVVTNIDVQSVEPTDEKTRDSLQKSVQLAIEITTKSQEATARHGNELKDQEAKGKLERQKISDKIEVEKAKTQWLELQAKSEAVQASGQSVAEAKAKAEALLIEVNSELQQAKLRAEAYLISAEAELKKLAQRQSIELDYTQRQNALEIEKARRTAEAEAERVKRVVNAIGRDTLVSIAQAGPEMQAKLLGGLGLKGYLITDGNTPVNLFSTAHGMMGSKGTGAGEPH